MWSEKTKERKKRVVILFNDLLMETKQLKDSLLFKRTVDILATTGISIDKGRYIEYSSLIIDWLLQGQDMALSWWLMETPAVGNKKC